LFRKKIFVIFKMPFTFNKAYFMPGAGDSTRRDYDRSQCHAGDIARDRKGGCQWGVCDKPYWCLTPDTEHISHYNSSLGDNPCTLQDANNEFWTETNTTNFDTAEAALKCSFPSVDANLLVNLSSDTNILRGGANDNSGVHRNPWEQLVYGIDTQVGNTTGFCEDRANLTQVVNAGGDTCYDVILNRAQAKLDSRQYCIDNPTEPRCACINMTQGIRHCLNNPTLPGCDTLVAEFNNFPGNAQTEMETQNFSPKCFAPDVCTRPGQFEPEQHADACSMKIQVCQQDLNLYGDIANQAIINIDQSMKCNIDDGDEPSAGTGDVDDDDGGGGGGGDDGGGGGGGDDDVGEASFTDFRSNPQAYIPGSVDDIKNDPKKKAGAMGIGGLIALAMMMMMLLVVAGSAGGGGGAPVRRRYR
jgi:hypothetical protein